jgi:hypothetical protein
MGELDKKMANFILQVQLSQMQVLEIYNSFNSISKISYVRKHNSNYKWREYNSAGRTTYSFLQGLQ